VASDQFDKNLATRYARAMLLCRQACAHFPTIPIITYSQCLALVEDKKTERVVFIDVRSHEEREVSMLPGAISRSDFECLALDPQAEAQQGLVLVPYCTIGFRSGEYSAALLATGWDNGRVYNGAGVVPFSYEPGFRLVSRARSAASIRDTADRAGEEATMQVHVFSCQWDVAHPEYEAHTFDALHSLFQGAMHLLRKWMS